MSFTYKNTSKEIRKAQVLGLLHLQSTPRKAEVVTWGYDLGTPSGRRDNCATALLSLLLVITAVTVSAFFVFFISGKQKQILVERDGDRLYSRWGLGYVLEPT